MCDSLRIIILHYLHLITVVLGADTLAGPALVHSLEKRGYVVIASCATAEAAEMLEKRSKGFVRALVLKPQDVCRRFRKY
jgi:nucleoside-diphosphate-sugar epimerase